MAQPNGYNPSFAGRVSAVGFDNLNSSGVCTTAVDTNTTTRRYVFSSGGNGFVGTITGVWLITKAGTTATMTLACEDGTVCTIDTATSAGGVVGASSLSNTTIDKDGTLGVIFSGTNSMDGSATVFVTYAVEDCS
jgi:hypothetical protein